jgi:hypothetical protein
VSVVAGHGLAKVFERLDARLYSFGEIVSGHTLKHVVAALSGGRVWWMLVKRRPA